MKGLTNTKMRWFQIAVFSIIVAFATPGVFIANDPSFEDAFSGWQKTKISSGELNSFRLETAISPFHTGKWLLGDIGDRRSDTVFRKETLLKS